MSEAKIMRVWRDPEFGFWRARLAGDGAAVEVHMRYGSWQIDHPEREGYSVDVVEPYKSELARRVRLRERQETELLEARLAEVAASGRCAARSVRDEGVPASSARLALQLAPGRIRGSTRALSPSS